MDDIIRRGQVQHLLRRERREGGIEAAADQDVGDVQRREEGAGEEAGDELRAKEVAGGMAGTAGAHHHVQPRGNITDKELAIVPRFQSKYKGVKEDAEKSAPDGRQCWLV